MKLSFGSPHLSIQSFPTVEIPSFTLITGVNGSGKTHLLRAINGGQVNADIAPNPLEDSRFFDWTSLVPNDTGNFNVAAIYGERDQIIQWARQERGSLREELHAWASRYDLIGKGLGGTSSILKLARTDIAGLIDDPGEAEEAWKKMQAIAKPALERVKNNARKNAELKAKLEELEKKVRQRPSSTGRK